MTALTVEEARAAERAAKGAVREAELAARAALDAKAAAEAKEREKRRKGTGSATVSRDELLAALKPVVAVVPARSQLPIVANVFIEATKGTLRLASSDLDAFCEASVEAAVKKPFSALTNARYLLSLVKATPKGGTITLAREDDVLKLDSEAFIEAEMKWLDPADWLRVPAWDAGARAQYCGSEFRQVVPRVFLATATGDSRPVLTGVAVNPDGEWAAADGFRVTTAQMKPLEGDLGAPAIFGRTALLAAAKRVTNDEQVTLEVHARRTFARATAGGLTWTQSLIHGIYPDYGAIIPKEWATRVTLPVAAVREALKLLAPVAKDGSGILRLEAKPTGKFTIEAKSEDLGAVRVGLMAAFEGEENRIAFNHRYLTDAMALFDDAFTLEWSEPSKQGVMRPVGRPGPVHVLMPMFVQW